MDRRPLGTPLHQGETALKTLTLALAASVALAASAAHAQASLPHHVIHHGDQNVTVEVIDHKPGGRLFVTAGGPDPQGLLVDLVSEVNCRTGMHRITAMGAWKGDQIAYMRRYPMGYAWKPLPPGSIAQDVAIYACEH